MRNNKAVTVVGSLLFLGLCSGASSYIGQNNPGAGGFVFTIGVVLISVVLAYALSFKRPSR